MTEVSQQETEDHEVEEMVEDNRQYVDYRIENKIAYVTLNKPEKYNALCIDLMNQLIEVAEQIKENRKVRAVILSGKGKGFCSGLDIVGSMKKPGASKKMMFKQDPQDQNIVQRVALVWRELPVPVIAVVHGVCYGGGFQIALGADFRYVTADSRYSILEGKWGIIPDMGAAVTLPELMGIDRAKELTFTARVFNADEAKEYGVVTKICDDPMQDALAFSEELKQKSPDAIMYAKKLYQETWLADDGVSLQKETDYQNIIIGTLNQLVKSGNNFIKGNIPFKKRKDG